MGPSGPLTALSMSRLEGRTIPAPWPSCCGSESLLLSSLLLSSPSRPAPDSPWTWSYLKDSTLVPAAGEASVLLPVHPRCTAIHSSSSISSPHIKVFLAHS